MCAYSAIVDNVIGAWPWESVAHQQPFVTVSSPSLPSGLTQSHVDALVKLLEQARFFDQAVGLKDCELDAKKKELRRLIESRGLKIEFPGDPDAVLLTEDDVKEIMAHASDSGLNMFDAIRAGSECLSFAPAEGGGYRVEFTP